MGKYWKRYSYDVIKLMLFHIVVGGFGVTLSAFEHMVFSGEEPAWAKVLFFIFIIGMYMFLIYGEMWKLGAKEAPVTKLKTKKFAGIFIALMGSILDFFIAIYMVVASFVTMPDVLNSVFATVDFIYNGMFLRIFKIVVTEEPQALLAGTYPVIYFITFLPAFIATLLGYYLGIKEKHLTKLFIHETPEEKEVRIEKKRLSDGDKYDR